MSKSKLIFFYNALFLVGIQLFLVSCSNLSRDNSYVNPTEHPELVDQSWLTDQSCSTPCWQGLEPGKSLQKDALSVAKSLSFLGVERVEPTDNAWTSFLCKVPSDKVCVSMRFENGLLSDLSLYPNYLITLDQVIEKFGTPDSYYYSRREVETKGCSIKFLWIKRQMILGYGDKPISMGDDLCDFIDQNNGKIPKGLWVQEPGTGQHYTLWKGFSE
jgi:hypothetical protein